MKKGRRSDLFEEREGLLSRFCLCLALWSLLLRSGFLGAGLADRSHAEDDALLLLTVAVGVLVGLQVARDCYERSLLEKREAGGVGVLGPALAVDESRLAGLHTVNSVLARD